MMCTTMDPRSTSTHSPERSPSTLTTRAPSAFIFSWRWLASARLWRFESALAMMIQSKSAVIFFTSSTTMSRPLMSSSAATAAFVSLSSLIQE
ncbi:hypothetical protein D3C83_58750 [compost metagenome]